MNTWIETYTGKKFSLLPPQPKLVCIEDIAHALSQQCRFTGHTKYFYSVAEHCWNVSFLAKQNPLWGLLHDASEAYLSDLSRPIKHLTPVGPPYKQLEDELMHSICTKFNLPFVMPADVRHADNVMLFTEKESLMTGLSWHDDNSTNSIMESSEPASGIVLWCWEPRIAEQHFLERFDFLTGEK